MAHTPGPWKVERFVDQVQVAAFSNDGNRILCFRGESDNTDDDTLLIAAAPELLSVLKAVMAEYCGRGTISHVHVKLARAVIAKATGE